MGRWLAFLALSSVFLAGAPARAACKLEQLVELPVTMEGPRPVIAAKINGLDARLLVDTGGFFSLLNPASAARFELKSGPLPPGLSVRGTTGDADIRVGKAKRFELQGIPFHDMDFLVGEHSMGSDDDGSIGENILGGFDAEFDLANGAIRLMLPNGCGDKPLAYWVVGSDTYGEMSIDPIAIPSLKISGAAKVNGRSIRVVFDTGAPRSMLTMRGARVAGLSPDMTGVISEGVTGGIGRRVARTWIAPVESFEIGGEQTRTTRVRFGEIEAGDADMVLGVDFFLSHRIYVAKSQNRLYFTYNGGPVFNLDGPTRPAVAAATSATSTTPTDPAAPEPKDATGYARRAAAFAARREYDLAIADYIRATQLEPSDPKHFYDLGLAHMFNRQPILAIGDFDQALKLKPDDAEALMVRGRMRLSEKDEPGARADFEAAAKADPSLALRVATDYAEGGLFDAAVTHLDAWINSHPKNEDLAAPLNERCWARALWNHDLDKALADCNEALSLSPGSPRLLDSRGLVRLRMGDLDRAITDYDAVLKLQPRTAWSLYGRGLAELKKGEKNEGDADLAAATAIDPRLPERAKGYGLAP